MERTVVSGIVKKVEGIDRHLSFVTLTPIANEGWSETRVPLYMEVGREYEGKVVDVITERSGFLGRNFEQTLEGANMSSSTKMPYSLVKQINDAYRRLEAQQERVA